MNIFDPSQFSNECAPIYSDDSIFFNLILNSNYENTKENCLLFLRNYSKRIHYTKRDIFRIAINELTLGDHSDLNIGKDESIYLIRQIIKKYSRNNIINALYDFVSLNEDENWSENNLINQEKNSSNFSNDFTNDKTQNSERAESKKDIQKIMNIINKKNKKKKEKKESDKKEKDNENNIISNGEGDILDDDNNVDKLLKFLEKKRKSSTFAKKEKRDKRPKKEQKENKEKEKEDKEKKNKSKNKKEEKKEKKDEKVSNKDQVKEEDKMNDEEIEKGDDDEDKEIKGKKDDKKDRKENEELKKDNWEEKNIKKEKEKIDIKNEINDFEKKEKNKIKDKMLIKKEDNILSSYNECDKFQRRSYKNRIRNINYLSPFKSFISKSISGISSPIEIIKLESVEDTNGDGNIIISPTKYKRSKDRIKSSNQLDILSYLNLSKCKNSKTLNEQVNKFGNHLIKDLKEKTFIYSYRIKRYQSFKNNIILFECNNNKCVGRGEYNIEKKIFRETAEHNVPANLHKLAFAHYNVRQSLLMDDCLGYQLFKDNTTFIKDKKVILLK